LASLPHRDPRDETEGDIDVSAGRRWKEVPSMSEQQKRPRGRPITNSERDVEIAELYAAGWTATELGGRFSISLRRVQQIIATAKAQDSPD